MDSLLMRRSAMIKAQINPYLPATEQIIKYLRRTANGATIGNGVARISEIKGNSLVWNQLVDTSTTSVDTISGRKYYTLIGGTASVVTGDGTPLSVTGGVDMMTDLMLLFGGSIPLGFSVADFQLVFPLPYYSYNPGEIINTTCAKTERVMWNQLVDLGVTLKPQATHSTLVDGVFTMQCYSDNAMNQWNGSLLGGTTGHIYYQKFKYIATKNFRFGGVFSSSLSTVLSASEYTELSLRNTANYIAGGFYFQVVAAENPTTNDYIKVKDIFVFDLTLMFGSGNEPTLQECEAIFAEDYYPYDAGTQKTITLEDGGIESRDSNNALIDTLHTKLTTMKGKLNGTGESVVVFPDGPARAGSTYDQVIVDNDGWCRRVRKNVGKYVFTGEEDVTLVYSTNVNGYKVLIPEGITGYTYTDTPLCSKYNSLNAKAFNLDDIDYDKIVYRRASQSAYIFNDSSIADVTAFKVAIVGVELLYQLETPETYILDEPVFLGYNAQNRGTENIIPLDTQDRPAVPLIADIKYRKAPHIEIEYLESDGNQYIDTLRVPNITDIIEEKFLSKGRSTGQSTSAWYGSMPSAGVILPRISIGITSTKFYVGFNATLQTTSEDSNAHTFKFYMEVGRENRYLRCDIDGALSPDRSNATGTVFTLSSYLFARHGNDGVERTDGNGTRIYYHKEFLADNTLQLDLIPVRKGNVGYMYDRVSGQYFGNLGTGNFILGPDK